MGDVSYLKDSVLEQAHEKGRLLLAEAREQIQKEKEEQESRLNQDKFQQRQARLQEINRRAQREIQQLENKKRQSTLVTKQQVLRELFEEAAETMKTWPAQQELAFLDGVLKTYPEEDLLLTLGSLSHEKFSPDQLADLLAAYPHVHLAEETLAGQAGFVLSKGRVDDTYLYSDLVDSVWQQESYRLAQEIFRDQTD